MSFDLTGLRKAINSLERSLAVIAKKDDNTDSAEMETLRAGVIQNFEFTYELCWKFMKRWLEMNVSSEIVDGVPRIELFRVSAEHRLITDVSKWMIFHKARNRTSHIYDEDVAEEVYGESKDFLPFAKDFFKRLEERNL